MKEAHMLYGTKRRLGLQGTFDGFSPLPAQSFKAEKVIVFTQFWQHVQLIAQNLSAAGADFAVFKRDRSAADKEEALLKFQVTMQLIPGRLVL
jgi:hypothetical protein